MNNEQKEEKYIDQFLSVDSSNRISKIRQSWRSIAQASMRADDAQSSSFIFKNTSSSNRTKFQNNHLELQEDEPRPERPDSFRQRKPLAGSSTFEFSQEPASPISSPARSCFRSFGTIQISNALSNKQKKKGEETKKQDEEEIGSVISIDLGSTKTCVGLYKDGQLEIIENEEGKNITPSIVAFTAEKEVLIGDKAKAQRIQNLENTISNIQRLMGREWSDPIVKETIKMYAFKVIYKDGKPHVKVKTANGEEIFAPEEICAMIIRKMKEIAEKHLEQRVTHANVIVPANFNDAQRRATQDAVYLSGLKVLSLTNAPSAAAITYGLDKKEDKKLVFVYALGGGNFDVSVIAIDSTDCKVLATDGDTRLGGENFDQRVLDHFIELYKKEKGKDICKDKKAIQRLRDEIQRAKVVLSTREKETIRIKSFLDGDDFVEILTRAKFEELNKDLFENTIKCVERVLKDAGKSEKDIDVIILVGGSSRIPKIQQLVKKSFKDKELHPVIDFDGAVISGAAAHASVLAGDKQVAHFSLTDVTPLTLGVQIIGGRMCRIIPKNTSIPTTKFDILTTVVDNQSVVSFPVYEGEFPMTKDNHLLDEFKLTGIPPAPRGVPKFKVTFQLDCNGILHVTAEDTKTGNRNQITINYKQKRLSPEDIDKMIEKAEKLNA